ncbi:MAG: transketolase-like TK C-terminal-containing protein, partial [Candidatus Eiseniibacteriota bacterium]
IEVIAGAMPMEFLAGSADLTGSNNNKAKSATAFSAKTPKGRFIHYGIREHGMAAALNGVFLHGGFAPNGATFLVFTDYARPAIRLSALMKLPVIWVFTHDSVFLGEDGPTHEPIEHLGSLRAIPNLMVARPADGLETAAAWALALERHDGPTLIALTRQNLPALERPSSFDPTDLRRGGYVLRESNSQGAVSLIATGSEVSLALAAAEKLAESGHPARVVSLYAPQLFLAQDRAMRERVLPSGGKRVSIEAGATDYWYRFVGLEGLAIGIDRFGESAPLAQIQQFFGLTPEKVAERVRAWLR